MGLGSVELVMEVEGSFGIAIPDPEASEINTVNDLFETIVKYLERKASASEHKPPVGCLTSAAFDRLRQALTHSFGVSRASVRPSSRVEELLPIAHRRSEWGSLSRVLDLRLPDLRRPTWMIAAIKISSVISLLAILGAFFLARVAGRPGFPASQVAAGVNALAFSFVVGSIAAFLISGRFQREFAADCQTLDDLSLALVRLNYVKLASAIPAINRDEVWRVLRAIIVMQLGVKPEEVTPAASFVRDFGID
jgi:acyl carrier protein